MSDILEVAKFDAGVNTASGRKQFSFVNTAGSLIGNREYKEGFDKFQSGCPCDEQYIWRALSAVADPIGRVLYENVKNYVDYVSNVDVCKVQALRSMVKMYGLEYKVFDRLDLLPPEVLDLVNLFSISKKYILNGGLVLQEYRDRLSAEGVIFDFRTPDGFSPPPSAAVRLSALSYGYPDGETYRTFVADAFAQVLSGFICLPYEDGGAPIYTLPGDDGVYDELVRGRTKYMEQYREGTEEWERRRYKQANGVDLAFDERAALDRIEAGEELEDSYQGPKAELIQMERERRARPYSSDRTSRYAFYKRRRVLEYAGFVVNKYFTDHKSDDMEEYPHDRNYFEVRFRAASRETADETYEEAGKKLIELDDGQYRLDGGMIEDVAASLADTALYIAAIRDRIKLQTRKNYMKGTYDLMLYVINEYLVDYSRLNPMFRDGNTYNDGETRSTSSVADLLRSVRADLSSHDIGNLTAVEYFDATEYYNIESATDARSDMLGTNDRFWRDPGGESLVEHDGLDPDFDAGSITSFYMDTVGLRDNYISDENALCAFLDAVFSLGAVDSFVHSVSRDEDGMELSSPKQLFGAQVEKYGRYSDELYREYLGLGDAWAAFQSYLSGEKYDWQTSDTVQEQALSAAWFAKGLVLERGMSSVSSVYDAYADRADQLSGRVDQGLQEYEDLLSGQYSFYFQKQSGYKYCFDGQDYKHQWYVDSPLDDGLEYWYDKLQAVGEYAAGSDEKGQPYITNWPVRDTVEYFYGEFSGISSKYKSMTLGGAVEEAGRIEHDWEKEYGFVDIDAPSLEDELRYGYDFMRDQIAQRKQYILDQLNGVKSQASNLQNLSQSIKNALTQAVSQFNDDREGQKLGESTAIYAVSLNKHDDDYEGGKCTRVKGKPSSGYDFFVKQNIGGDVYYYHGKKSESSGAFGYMETSIKKYVETDSVADRCRAFIEYMSAPTSYYFKKDGPPQMNYEMLNEGVLAAINQVQSDQLNLESQTSGLVMQIQNMGYEFAPSGDVDQKITQIIEYINENIDDSAIEKDAKVKAYRTYYAAVIALSSQYLPVKYEYDSIFKDPMQAAYLSEFQADAAMTLAALDRLSAYSVARDAANKDAILDGIARMKQRYQEAVEAYQEAAEALQKEYMLPQSFQPYLGYMEDMVSDMRSALETDVDEKTAWAARQAEDEYEQKIGPAARTLAELVGPYRDAYYRLPDAVQRRMGELYVFDDPSYARQKEMFLAYGGRSFCYYPYYNLKNLVHSSYQVHPFMWNFVKRDKAYGMVAKTFYSVNVDELEAENVARAWRGFFGEYGEAKYADLSKARYPDYSGYQSRYEDSRHVAENTLFVSEVVDYDGAFYPPAVEWLRRNGVEKAVSSLTLCEHGQAVRDAVDEALRGLSSLEWGAVSAAISGAAARLPAERAEEAEAYVYGACYEGRELSDLTLRELRSAASAALSGDDTFYGRFYRQLRLDQRSRAEDKAYIAAQIMEYWSDETHTGGGPGISAITEPRPPADVYDIYRYGIDSYGNMYCLYKNYGREDACYKRRQSEPGELWIRLKNHPLAFPAFSGSHPNVYLGDESRRHMAFVNLLDLFRRDPETGEPMLDPETGEPVQLSGDQVSAVPSDKARCIYDFEFTKDRDYVSFVTMMRDLELSCGSPAVQNYQNPWLVGCRMKQDALDDGDGRTALTLYPYAGQTDYFKSGDDYLLNPALSSEESLSGDGVELYQYIGSYLKGNSGIYHAYARKRVKMDEAGCVARELLDDIKICPVVGGRYRPADDITGALASGGRLSVTGADVCLAYDSDANVLNFAAQTVLPRDAALVADFGQISLSANASGPVIYDPVSPGMNSHDVLESNVTLFRKQAVARKLRDARGSFDASPTFNVNADMSYFPSYPGAAGRREMWRYDGWPEYRDGYCVELLGQARDISREISFVNPRPDPYLDAESILSGFANARVYQDYAEYSDETLKTVDNELIGENSPVLAPWAGPVPGQQSVARQDGVYVWRIDLGRVYRRFDLKKALKLKVLLFSKKCCGKSPYLFSDVSALAGTEFKDLSYDVQERPQDGSDVLSAADYVFGYNNRVVVESTLDGMGEAGAADTNHIYNVGGMQARLVADEGSAVLEVRFNLADPAAQAYTFVPKGQLQAVFLDVRNLEMFNYFHYLDVYGMLRVIDNFSTYQELNDRLTVKGDGWTIYNAGHRYTDEELMERLKTYYEYKGRMLPLSGVDLSEYDDLSDVYVLKGSRRLSFKVDEEFRYELSNPAYFYPTVNAKFPLTPGQYAAKTTTFRENGAPDVLIDVFGENNLFVFDMQDPVAVLSSMGRVDVPVQVDDSECVLAYEEYGDPAGGELSSMRNCDLYDRSDPRSLAFVQFVADAPSASGGVDEDQGPFDVPDSLAANVRMDQAAAGIALYLRDRLGVGGVVPAAGEAGRTQYIQESMGFTVDEGSIPAEHAAQLQRIYVNYAKHGAPGEERIRLYFNYMNYLDSPYLRVQDGRPYVDLIDNTYLMLDQDEDGTLDVVAQFRYYRDGQLYGCRNMKLASYRIYNISDDKPKFLIKKVDELEPGEASNAVVQPRVRAALCDVVLDLEQLEDDGQVPFTVDLTLETDAPLGKAEFWLDYPSDFMEFTASSGDGWTLFDEQSGYARLVMDPGARRASLPARTAQDRQDLYELDGYSYALYVDRYEIVGANGVFASAETEAGRVTIRARLPDVRINALLTDSYGSQDAVYVFDADTTQGGAIDAVQLAGRRI